MQKLHKFKQTDLKLNFREKHIRVQLSRNSLFGMSWLQGMYLMRLYTMCVYIRKLLFLQLNTKLFLFFWIFSVHSLFHSHWMHRGTCKQRKKERERVLWKNIDAGEKFMDCLFNILKILLHIWSNTCFNTSNKEFNMICLYSNLNAHTKRRAWKKRDRYHCEW